MWRKKKQDSKLGDNVIGLHNVFAKLEPTETVKTEVGATSETVTVVFLKKAFLHWSSCKTYETGTEVEISRHDAEILLKTNHVSLKGKQ